MAVSGLRMRRRRVGLTKPPIRHAVAARSLPARGHGDSTMYIAMNRFKVLKDAAQDFENVWYSRESYLHELPGFVEFHLLKGPEREDHVLYSSHTVWRSYADFEGWTKSEAFRKAHARAG